MVVNKYGVGEFFEFELVMVKNLFVVLDVLKVLEIIIVIKDLMIVVWERLVFDGGSEIFGYVFEKRDKEGVRWIRCYKRLIGELRLRVIGFLENYNYEFRVLVENVVGFSELSLFFVY